MKCYMDCYMSRYMNCWMKRHYLSFIGRLLLFCLMALLFLGCQSNSDRMYQTQKSTIHWSGAKNKIQRQNNFKLPRDSRIGIVMPFVPVAARIPVKSLEEITQLEMRAFSTYFLSVMQLESLNYREKVFHSAEKKGIQFVIFSQIDILDGFTKEPVLQDSCREIERFDGAAHRLDRMRPDGPCQVRGELNILKDIKMTFWLYDVSARSLRDVSLLSFSAVALLESNLSDDQALYSAFQARAYTYFPN